MYRIIEKRNSGIIYTGLCGNNEKILLSDAVKAFPQYSNLQIIKCKYNCKNCRKNDTTNILPF